MTLKAKKVFLISGPYFGTVPKKNELKRMLKYFSAPPASFSCSQSVYFLEHGVPPPPKTSPWCNTHGQTRAKPTTQKQRNTFHAIFPPKTLEIPLQKLFRVHQTRTHIYRLYASLCIFFLLLPIALLGWYRYAIKQQLPFKTPLSRFFTANLIL